MQTTMDPSNRSLNSTTKNASNIPNSSKMSETFPGFSSDKSESLYYKQIPSNPPTRNLITGLGRLLA